MESRPSHFCWKIAICLWMAAAPALCFAQPRVQLPTDPSPWVSTPAPTGLFPSTAPAATAFDPYAPTFRPNTAPIYAPAPTYNQPMFTSPNWNLGNLFGWNQPPNLYGSSPSFIGTQPIPIQNQVPVSPYPPTYNVPATTYPSGVYPNSTPNVLFPGTGNPGSLNNPWAFQNPSGTWGNGQFNNNWNSWWTNTGNNLNYGVNQTYRFFQGPRFRHTWLPGTDSFNGKSPNSLEINDTDVSLVFAVPNFLNSTRPLYIIPSYSQHLWEGPSAPGSDIPGSAFSAFIDSGWDTNPQQTLGLELGVRVGVFSAFDAINAQSIRVQGKAMGRVRLTPTSTARLGVFYIDRNKLKLVPAGGILWIPNPDTRFDIFFPEPKLSHYVATLGNTDVWWYLTGYYGGGAWTIKQTDGTNDEIDINDIRLLIGLDFGHSDQIRQGFRLGFVEAGYAFNRELIYHVRSSSNLDLENSLVVRAGFAY